MRFAEAAGTGGYERTTGEADTEAVLIERTRRNDPAAIRALVELHSASVHALAWRMVGSRRSGALADDLTQETFVRAIQALPRFEPGGRAKLRTWLLTIATRTVIDWLRRNPAAKATEPLGHEPMSEGDDPERARQRRETAEAVARAIDSLSPDMRATFVLRAYHELELAEIADALGVDLGTVKSRLSRARVALRAALEGVAR